MRTIYLIQHKAGYGGETTPLKACESEEQAQAFVEMMATIVRGNLEVKPIPLEGRDPVVELPARPLVGTPRAALP